MRRRDFIKGIVGSATAWPLAARAQQPAGGRIPRIGIIDDTPIWDHFRQGLRDNGYVVGQNVALEYRSAQSNVDLLRRAALEWRETFDGLPIGVQLYGNFCREDLLLQIAAQIERARPEWFGAVPELHVGSGSVRH